MGASGIRGFGFGFASIIFVLYLKFIGFNPFIIGLLLSVSSAGSFAANILVGKYADRVGRKRSLIVFALILLSSGLILLVTTNFYAIVVSFAVGGMNATGMSQGPYQAIEQAALAGTTDLQHRNSLYSAYNVISSLLSALGSLFVGAQSGIQAYLQLHTFDSYRLFFVVYVCLGFVLVVMYARLSSRIELKAQQQGRSPSPSSSKARFASRDFLVENSTIIKLAGVLGLDAFSAGFLSNSLIILWLSAHFDVGGQELAYVFFISSLAQTAAYLFTARIANRIGMVRTMVATQLPSNFLFFLFALSPTSAFALATYLVRSPFSQMDIPARQAYVVSVVPEEKRTPATAIIAVTRNGTQTLSPGLAAYFIEAGQYATPILIGVAMKFTYTILLYFGFRHKRER